MTRITKSITFDDAADAELLAWIAAQMQRDARPGERPDFSRFVRGALHRAFSGHDRLLPVSASPLPDTLLADIRAVVEAAVGHALRNTNITGNAPAQDIDPDDDDFSGLLLD